MKTSMLVFAALGSAALAGCSSTMSLDPTTQAAVTKAFNNVCPAVSAGALDPLVASFNANVQNAYAAAKTICANGAPTNMVVAGIDILAVEPLLMPYTSKIKIKA